MLNKDGIMLIGGRRKMEYLNPYFAFLFSIRDNNFQSPGDLVGRILGFH